MRIKSTIIMGIIWAIIPFIIYWLGGGNFDRDLALSITSVYSILCSCSAMGMWYNSPFI